MRSDGDVAAGTDSHDILGSVFDTLSSHIAVLDARGTLVAVNAAWRRFAADNGGTDRGAWLGANYLDVCARARADCAEAGAAEDGLRRVIAGLADEFEFEYPCDAPDRPRWFVLNAKRYAGPGPVRIVVAHTDVTERHLAERALRDADRRKDEFLAMLAHELRNPLAPLVNATRVIQRNELLTDVGRTAIDMIERQTTHLSLLVADLLEVGRITRGKIELRREPVRVDDAVRRALESTAGDAAARGHRIDATLPGDPVWIDADPVRVAQMLGNLLGNACKYTPDGGRIAVTVAATPGEVALRVADTGIGIEPDKIPQLFELFHQLDATLDRASGGLGIGLTIVRQLAELHGGRVSAESAGRGLGSTFTIVLRRIDAPGGM